jgi:hypothetical protein
VVKAVLMPVSILRAKLPGLDRENGGNTETGRFASYTSAEEVIAMLVGGRPLPASPDQRTFFWFVGMFQACHKPTLPVLSGLTFSDAKSLAQLL